jgi:uncharacterized protein (TIGR00730 family)
MPPIVAVFGSARIENDDPIYADSEAVGRALGLAGYTVMTGGYDGVMDAASKGANQAGAHVIGVTVRDLEAYRETTVNQWVKEEVKYDTLRQRLHHLIDNADAYVVMPGGIGTLQEIIEVWQLMRIGHLERKPILCYGDFWHKLLNDMMVSPFVGKTDNELLEFVHDTDALLARLALFFADANPSGQVAAD